MPKTGFQIYPNYGLDELGKSMLNLVNLTQNMFIKFKEKPSDDITLVPLHLSFEYLTAFKMGAGSQDGLQ